MAQMIRNRHTRGKAHARWRESRDHGICGMKVDSPEIVPDTQVAPEDRCKRCFPTTPRKASRG